MTIVSKEQILMLHDILIDETGGIKGLRDDNLLESALFSAFQSFNFTDLYPTLEEKAARLAFSLIQNHAFVDGNKRIGVFVMLVFLELNGIVLQFEQPELISLGLGVANNSIGHTSIVHWIIEHKI